MKTIKEFLDLAKKQYDFNKRIGTIAHSIAVTSMHDFFKNEKLKIELKKCANLTQMQNTIAQLTNELEKERSQEELQKFATNFHKLAKMSRL